MKYNPSDAAKACNVSVNTIRGWIRDYGEHFTPGARGESGNRLLSDKDMNTLKYIAALRSEGMQKDAIRARLQETAIGETETLAPMQKASEALQTSPDAPDASILAIQVLDAINAQNRRIEALEHGRRDAVLLFGAGFIAALMFVLIVLLVAVLWGGFR